MTCGGFDGPRARSTGTQTCVIRTMLYTIALQVMNRVCMEHKKTLQNKVEAIGKVCYE